MNTSPTAYIGREYIPNGAGELQGVPTLQELLNEEIAFADATFGPRPYTGPLHHLQEEIKEVIEADRINIGEDPANASLIEFADCLCLLLDAYRLRHPALGANKLLIAAWNKIQVNKKRKWGKPDANGVVKHIG